MLKIDQTHLERFRQIKQRFYSVTRIPEYGNWMKRSNNEIWLEFVAQVVVVGRSDPWEKLKANIELKNTISWDNLSQKDNLLEIQLTVNEVLLAVGTRYASRDLSKSAKARAIAYNLSKLKEYKNGPKDFLLMLSEIRGQSSDKLKVKTAIQAFQFIKNKGARDLLMELGLVTNAVALDVRITKLLRKAGILVPAESMGNTAIYDEVENDILRRICAPLGLSGVELDRMLYQNYDAILSMQF